MPPYDIKYLEKIIPDAYHGTSKAAAEEVKRTGFKISTGPDQFFGDGVYFFESSRWHAENWAQRRYGVDIAVISAIINLGRCLDFHNHEHQSLAREYERKIRYQALRRGGSAANKRLKITDALVINFIANLIQVDTVRGSYVQPGYGPAFEGSKVFGYHQLIICVRNLGSILQFNVI